MNKKYNNSEIKELIKTEWFNQFYEDQKKEIKLGLKSNVDVSIYAKIDFTWQQMEEIRLGLKQGLDVSEYAKSEITVEEMKNIKEELKRRKENEKDI